MVRLDRHLDVEVARRAAVDTGLPLTIQAYAIPGIHSGRNLHRQGTGLAYAAFTVTLVARHLDMLSATATGGAGLLYREKALLHAYLTMAATGGAGLFGRARLGTRPVTAVAFDMARHTNIYRGTGNGTLQVELQVVAQVTATLGGIGIAPTRAAEDIAEHVAENITEAAGSGTTKATTTKAACLSIHPGMAELVIGRPLLAVGKNFVGFRHLTKLSRRTFIIRVTVRVMPLRQASIRLLDLFEIGPTLDAEYFVIIAFGHGSMRLLVFAARLKPRKRQRGSRAPALPSSLVSPRRLLLFLVVVDFFVLSVDHVIVLLVAALGLLTARLLGRFGLLGVQLLGQTAGRFGQRIKLGLDGMLVIALERFFQLGDGTFDGLLLLVSRLVADFFKRLA